MVVVYGRSPTRSRSRTRPSPSSRSRSCTRNRRRRWTSEPTSTKFTFKGEAALTTAIDFLQGGKAKTVIYFTQGHGELAFGPEGEQDQGGGSISTLIEALGGGNYDLRPLPLGPTTKEIPPTPTSW